MNTQTTTTPPPQSWVLVGGRHAMPPNRGNIWDHVNPAEWAAGDIPKASEAFIRDAAANSINIIVTGFGPALAEALRIVFYYNRSATLWHFNPTNQTYWPQSLKA